MHISWFDSALTQTSQILYSITLQQAITKYFQKSSGQFFVKIFPRISRIWMVGMTWIILLKSESNPTYVTILMIFFLSEYFYIRLQSPGCKMKSTIGLNLKTQQLHMQSETKSCPIEFLLWYTHALLISMHLILRFAKPAPSFHDLTLYCCF